MLLPANFAFPVFAVLLLMNGIGVGLFTAPNTTAIMNSVKPTERGAASGMRATFQNSAQVLSIGLFFSLMVVGLASTLPATMTAGLTAHGVSHATASHLAHLPPVGLLFAAFLGYNPIQKLLGPATLSHLTPRAGADAHRAVVLPAPHLGAVHRRDGDRVRRRAGDVPDRGGGVVEPGEGSGALDRRDRSPSVHPRARASRLSTPPRSPRSGPRPDASSVADGLTLRLMRHVRVIPVLALVVGLVLMTLAPGGGATTTRGAAGFYDPPSPLPKKAPGTIIRTVPIAAPAGRPGVEGAVPLALGRRPRHRRVGGRRRSDRPRRRRTGARC